MPLIEIRKREQMVLGEDVDLIGEAGIKWENGHKRTVLPDDSPSIRFLLFDYIAEKTPAFLFLVFSGRVQFSLKLGWYERKAIDLSVRMWHSHSNDLAFVLKLQDIFDLRLAPQLSVTRLPESYQFNYMASRKLSQRRLVLWGVEYYIADPYSLFYPEQLSPFYVWLGRRNRKTRKIIGIDINIIVGRHPP